MSIIERGPRKRQWKECYSTNLGLDLLRPFLERIVPLIDSGFGSQEVQQVIDLANSMSVSQEKSLKFPIVMEGRKSILGVRLFMDDIASPDIYVVAESSFCGRISTALEESDL
jgi:hypothetical protein